MRVRVTLTLNNNCLNCHYSPTLVPTPRHWEYFFFTTIPAFSCGFLCNFVPSTRIRNLHRLSWLRWNWRHERRVRKTQHHPQQFAVTLANYCHYCLISPDAHTGPKREKRAHLVALAPTLCPLAICCPSMVALPSQKIDRENMLPSRDTGASLPEKTRSLYQSFAAAGDKVQETLHMTHCSNLASAGAPRRVASATSLARISHTLTGRTPRRLICHPPQAR